MGDTTTAAIDAVQPEGQSPSLQAQEADLQALEVQQADYTEPSPKAALMERLDSITSRPVAGTEAFEPAAEPGVRMLSPETVGTDGAAVLESEGETLSNTVRESVRNLSGAFSHAVEVEIVAKTGTSMTSSMNKLMSGN
ncbi:hypothetical protein [uncultured Tateyamaria sp.]|uniref:hypothetical protein n=1 Tax=uncultured Tateyamaria sp. TaxID=455651 RepID=UPI0026305CAB|nr:hypothetical protein [uncultured Tateyamaria sp.]